MTLAFIGGTGNLGFGLAIRCAQAGHEIKIGSRSPEKAEAAAARIRELVPNATVVGDTNEKAAQGSKLIFLALPFAAQKDILPSIAPYTEGKIVIDTTVPMIFGKPPVYDTPSAGSAAENVKTLLPGANVVAGFHTVSAASLAEPGRQIQCDALLCGDDDAAKETVSEIARVFIQRVFDVGPLCNAQSIERLTPMLIGLNQRYKKRHIGITLSGVE